MNFKGGKNMAEFASNAKGNAALTTGIIGTSLGALNALGGAGGCGNVLGGLFGGGCGCNGVNTPVNRYELGLENEIAKLRTEVSLRDSNIYGDQKILEVYKYFDGKIEGINAKLCEQAVFNATQTAAMNCMGSQIAQLYGLTKLIVPATNICPSPMPEFNSWTAPTATAGA
jgi:hypothetical protein